MQAASPCMRRCLAALAEWERLSSLCRAEWRRAEPHVRREVAPLAAHAAWHMGHWNEMANYTAELAGHDSSDTSAGFFLSAVLSVHEKDFDSAKGMCSQNNMVWVCKFVSLQA